MLGTKKSAVDRVGLMGANLSKNVGVKTLGFTDGMKPRPKANSEARLN
ncbi:hypothetical protein PN467_23065 [Microcystis aeruginosa CS-563/04]|jgi:hypothetical protein|nr:hypothetical protein [Microcystis aeruginosa]MDB9423308.1 hypothetical protein [Microcystis aeruginosa CS-563/04]